MSTRADLSVEAKRFPELSLRVVQPAATAAHGVERGGGEGEAVASVWGPSSEEESPYGFQMPRSANLSPL